MKQELDKHLKAIKKRAQHIESELDQLNREINYFSFAHEHMVSKIEAKPAKYE